MKKIALSMLVILMLFTSACTMSVTETENQKEGVPSITGQENFCANNPSLDLGIRALDVLSATTDYDLAPFYLKNLETGTIVQYTIDDASGVFDTFANALKCGNTKGYEIYVMTTQDGFNAVQEVISISSDELFQDPVEKTIKVSEHTAIKVKAYNEDLRESLGASSSTAYQNVPATFDETGTTPVAITIGTDGYLDIELTLAPQSANMASGKSAYLCLNYADDSNVDDWEQSSIDISFEGKALSEATLTANDAMTLSAYEKCYTLPHPVGMNGGEYDSVSVVKLYMESQSAVNPDFDPVLRYVEVGDYQSTKDDNMMLTGVVSQDNSARTALGTATPQLITIDIA